MSDKTVFYADSISDILYQKNSISDLTIVGGCSAIKELPQRFLSTLFIKELKWFEKRERFIDFGPAVTFSEILDIGPDNLPSVIFESIMTIANPQVRNIATIGGNICNLEYRHTLFAPLLALDAKLEFQKQKVNSGIETMYVPMTKFASVPDSAILTKIRIPMEEWDVAIFRRFGSSHIINENSATFTFLANSQRGTLANLRIAFAGPFVFRSIDLENRLIGAHLPLPEKSIKELVDEASVFYDEAAYGKNPRPILKQQFLNILRFSLGQLT